MGAVETLPGRGNAQPARYFLSSRLTYRMLVNNIKRTITEPERDAVIAQFAAGLASTGPFREMKVVTADPSRDAADVLAIANWSAQREIHCGTMKIRFTCRLVVGVVR